MRFKFISPVLAAIALLLGTTASFGGTENSRLDANKQSSQPTPAAAPAQESTSARGMNFICDTSSDTPITIARISLEDSQEERPMLHWKKEYFPSRSQAEELCQQVAAKLQNYYENDELKNFALASGWVDGQPVVCIEQTKDSDCTQDRVLFTLETTNKPGNALYEMLAADLQEQQEERPPTRGDFPTRFGFDWLLF